MLSDILRNGWQVCPGGDVSLQWQCLGGWLRGHGKANVGNCGNMSGNPGVPAVCHGKYYFQNFVIDNFQSLLGD